MKWSGYESYSKYKSIKVHRIISNEEKNKLERQKVGTVRRYNQNNLTVESHFRYQWHDITIKHFVTKKELSPYNLSLKGSKDPRMKTTPKTDYLRINSVTCPINGGSESPIIVPILLCSLYIQILVIVSTLWISLHGLIYQ